LSKTPEPKASNWRVLKPYSDSMRKLLDNGYKAKLRPSGHEISENFSRDNQGAIPPNLLILANTDSNSTYLRQCREHGMKPHPARFPHGLPEFFIKFLTEPGDLVIDPFAGSNITGEVAERLQRRWLAFELAPHYLEGSKYRFPSLRAEASLFDKGFGASTAEEDGPEHFTANPTTSMSQMVLLEEPATFDPEDS